MRYANYATAYPVRRDQEGRALCRWCHKRETAAQRAKWAKGSKQCR